MTPTIKLNLFCFVSRTYIFIGVRVEKRISFFFFFFFLSFFLSLIFLSSLFFLFFSFLSLSLSLLLCNYYYYYFIFLYIFRLPEFVPLLPVTSWFLVPCAPVRLGSVEYSLSFHPFYHNHHHLSSFSPHYFAF